MTDITDTFDAEILPDGERREPSNAQIIAATLDKLINLDPHKFDMDHWLQWDLHPDSDANHGRGDLFHLGQFGHCVGSVNVDHCGTTACLAGWLALTAHELGADPGKVNIDWARRLSPLFIDMQDIDVDPFDSDYTNWHPIQKAAFDQARDELDDYEGSTLAGAVALLEAAHDLNTHPNEGDPQP